MHRRRAWSITDFSQQLKIQTVDADGDGSDGDASHLFCIINTFPRRCTASDEDVIVDDFSVVVYTHVHYVTARITIGTIVVSDVTALNTLKMSENLDFQGTVGACGLSHNPS